MQMQKNALNKNDSRFLWGPLSHAPRLGLPLCFIKHKQGKSHLTAVLPAPPDTISRNCPGFSWTRKIQKEERKEEKQQGNKPPFPFPFFRVHAGFGFVIVILAPSFFLDLGILLRARSAQSLLGSLLIFPVFFEFSFCYLLWIRLLLWASLGVCLFCFGFVWSSWSAFLAFECFGSISMARRNRNSAPWTSFLCSPRSVPRKQSAST